MDFGDWWSQVRDEDLQLFAACLCETVWHWRNKVTSEFHTVSGILERELLAILLALKVARERGVRKIKIYQIQGGNYGFEQWSCLPYASGHLSLFESCLCVCKCFDLVVFAHCPRSLSRYWLILILGSEMCKIHTLGAAKDIAP
uniref:RNase H type-1 domain-containing protein n=1 Tax=Cannabis sativa TaxID=3483 RepID=A0A803PKC7_CANSA